MTGEPAAGVAAPVGVLLLSYGTPARPEDVEAYYTHIRRGRPPTAEQLEDLRRRYRAIGGVSPLAARTRAQAEGVQRALDRQGPGRFLVVSGSKHSAPFIEDAVAGTVGAGARAAAVLVLAPHYSALSVEEYLERAEAAAADARLRLHPVRSWHLEPVLIRLLADRLGAALEETARAGAPRGAVRVLVTAHSLPERILATGDPYPRQLEETARAVAERAGVADWRVAWQSAGRTPEPWLGPDVAAAIRQAAADGRRGVVVCPAGFTADHLEVLYDLDVEAAGVAREEGLAFARTGSLNDDPEFCALLAGLAVRAVAG